MARIFISHASANNAEALALREWLVSEGWNDLFLDIHPIDGLVAADRWQAALRRSIGYCRAVIFCLSPEWVDSRYCISEFEAAMQMGAAPVGVKVKSMPLDKVPGEMTKVWQIVDLTLGGTPVPFTVAPPPLRQPTTVSYPREELQRIKGGLAKLGLVGLDADSFAWPPEGEAERAPYRGLSTFQAIDAGVFFGRDSDLVRVREELIALREKGGRQLFVIMGASGSGKSSFLRAGVLPRLGREERDFYALPPIRPERDALSGQEGLAQAVSSAFGKLGEPRALGDVRTDLREPGALPKLLGELQALAGRRISSGDEPSPSDPPTIVLAIDQAEELFTPEARDEAEWVMHQVASAIRHGPGVIVVLTIRSDRFHEIQKAKPFEGIPKHLFDLPPVRTFAFDAAIQGPASRADPPIEVAPALVTTLTSEAAAQGADPLPLLAFALERLYVDYGKTPRKDGIGPAACRLTEQDYRSIGGLKGAIEAVVKQAFADPQHPPAIPEDAGARERLLAAAFIPALVQIDEATGQSLRRIAALSEIPDAAGGLINRLVAKRLLVQGARRRPDGSTEPTVEVAHESLLRQWDLLKRLIDQQASDLKSLGILERAAEAWDTNGGGAEWLGHSGGRLVAAEALLENPAFQSRLSGIPATYLAACREKQAGQDTAAVKSAVMRKVILAMIVISVVAALMSWLRH